MEQKSSDSGGSGSKQNVEFMFLAKTDNSRTIFTILNTLFFKKEQNVTIRFSKTGIKFTIEQSRSMQGQAILQSTIFQEYNYHGDAPAAEFSVKLKVLLDCLNIFGVGQSAIRLQIAYKSYGSALLLIHNGS
eukprot:TRINITY_DN7512_c0_g1_i1.p1 TRINITY_DN7512_c0_g1~~TRINITY_DN7512_c0_g1_i1.p1  ORF type:complete len:132 (+),score=18.75 TRINITY_DN7512_c0_g1_i1:72-467(+)